MRRRLRIILALPVVCLAATALAQGQPNWPGEFGPSGPQSQDPYAAERMAQCRDLGSFAVVDGARPRKGTITVAPGAPCADLLSLQPSWMPYLQLNGTIDRGSGLQAGDRAPSAPAWPGKRPGVHR